MDNNTTSVVRMESAVIRAEDRRVAVPLPQLPITIRLATTADIPFIDELQKKSNKSLGFMPRGTLEGKIAREEVLIAEEDGGRSSSTVDSGGGGWGQPPSRLGYLIGNDRYFKRDELGCIFQLCVVPGRRRGLVAATLLKALFERASYGCKLYSCWCAQDLEANHFWEAMGFVPVAFRTGSRNRNKRADGLKGARIHIFWQKRIRAGDTETPYWYPSETGGGSIGEDRIVLPIDPRLHWSEVKVEVLPGQEVADRDATDVNRDDAANAQAEPASGQRQSTTPARRAARRTKAQAQAEPKLSRAVCRLVMPQFASKLKADAEKAAREAKEAKTEAARPAPKIRQKNDPAKVKAARELRDRYMEQINQHAILTSNAKYDVSRMIPGAPAQTTSNLLPVDQKLLAA